MRTKRAGDGRPKEVNGKCQKKEKGWRPDVEFNWAERIRNMNPFVAIVPNLSRYTYQPWIQSICTVLKQLIMALKYLTTKCILILNIIKL